MALGSVTYNPVGKLGPFYERPEYRPPSQSGLEGNQDSQNQAAEARDKRTLSPKAKEALKAAPAKAPAVFGKLNAVQAQALAAATAGLIARLDPGAANQGPHFTPNARIMAPCYA